MDERHDEALAPMREHLERQRQRYIATLVPVGAVLLLAAFVDWTTPLQVAAAVLALLPLAQGLRLLRALYRYAARAGGRRYAHGQMAVTLLLAPIVGPILIPLLVCSDVDKGVTDWRQSTAPPRWLVFVETVVVADLFVLGAILVLHLGVVGVFVAALALPVFYGLFAAAVRRRPV